MPKKWLLVGTSLIVIIASFYLGSIPPSPLYYLKVNREEIQTFFIFGDEDKANWFLTRANKRLMEAEQLRRLKWDFLAEMQVNTASRYQKQAENLLSLLKDKVDINYLIDKSNQNKEIFLRVDGIIK